MSIFSRIKYDENTNLTRYTHRNVITRLYFLKLLRFILDFLIF